LKSREGKEEKKGGYRGAKEKKKCGGTIMSKRLKGRGGKGKKKKTYPYLAILERRKKK